MGVVGVVGAVSEVALDAVVRGSELLTLSDDGALVCGDVVTSGTVGVLPPDRRRATTATTPAAISTMIRTAIPTIRPVLRPGG